MIIFYGNFYSKTHAAELSANKAIGPSLFL